MQALIDRIETVIHRDVGRGMDAVFEATQGGLFGAASALAASAAPRIGLITGFFVPGGDPPAAETDGPAGAALMARGFVGAGLACRLATDTVCASACRVALDAAGAGAVAVDTVAPGDTVDALVELWRRDGVDWVIAIERCGPAADGHPRNMRGTDILANAAPLDRLFSAGPWRTIAIGDGGNEIGMGRVPRALIARHVPLGEMIGCVVPADFLIAAGVSHWGAYAVMAALAAAGLVGGDGVRAGPGARPGSDRGDGAGRPGRRWGLAAAGGDHRCPGDGPAPGGDAGDPGHYRHPSGVLTGYADQGNVVSCHCVSASAAGRSALSKKLPAWYGRSSWLGEPGCPRLIRRACAAWPALRCRQ
jgi:D-glutamate cyclase